MKWARNAQKRKTKTSYEEVLFVACFLAGFECPLEHLLIDKFAKTVIHIWSTTEL